MCSNRKTRKPSRLASKSPPATLGERLYFVLFVSMCVFGAAVIVDTGPFPLNYVFGATAIVLPMALVIKRQRRLEKAQHNDVVGSIS